MKIAKGEFWFSDEIVLLLIYFDNILMIFLVNIKIKYYYSESSTYPMLIAKYIAHVIGDIGPKNQVVFTLA